MNTHNHIQEITLSVRDYECDIEGIVNNAVYLNYFEHARHEFLKASGVSFMSLHEQGYDPVVVRVEVDYIRSLVSGDRFIVRTGVRRKGQFRFIFDQRIERESDGEPMTRAVVTATFVHQGRPEAPPEMVEQLFEKAASR